MSPDATATANLIHRYYDAFNAADTEAMIALLSDDVRHDVNQGDVTRGGQRIGKDAFRVFCAHMSRCYREHLSKIVVMPSEDGTHAAAEFIVEGTYLSTDEGLPQALGQSYRLPAGTFFEIGHGKIVRITTYYNLTDWMRQVSGEKAE
ncbi:MAG: ketosteroid isomerase-related protein [Pseudomonadota bacterium]